MKRIRLDVTNISTVKALHIYLAYMLDFPAYYGKNLDALHDLLGDIAEPTKSVLVGRAAGDEMSAYLSRLEHVFEDSAQENGQITFERA